MQSVAIGVQGSRYSGQSDNSASRQLLSLRLAAEAPALGGVDRDTAVAADVQLAQDAGAVAHDALPGRLVAAIGQAGAVAGVDGQVEVGQRGAATTHLSPPGGLGGHATIR